jgi:hypothetical protein
VEAVVEAEERDVEVMHDFVEEGAQEGAKAHDARMRRGLHPDVDGRGRPFLGEAVEGESDWGQAVSLLVKSSLERRTASVRTRDAPREVPTGWLRGRRDARRMGRASPH